MPAVSSLQPEDKATIKNALSKGGNSKILTATVARVFYQRGTSWRYSGVQGGLCLVVDKQRGGVWFKIVDLLVSPSPKPSRAAAERDALGSPEGAAISSAARPPSSSLSLPSR